ncbi:hypothetical protein [Aquimarina algiphila]|uniref:hypothetical protein n=1 Tax=Aquimarina algiphila TaxID=2047982 RepID=UPI0023305518|nr:hypothetical protein [Aquimarina algiphila]
MLPDHIDEIPPEILYGVLNAMNIDIGDFMYHLLNDKPKEIMIYAKIYCLYVIKD